MCAVYRPRVVESDFHNVGVAGAGGGGRGAVAWSLGNVVPSEAVTGVLRREKHPSTQPPPFPLRTPTASHQGPQMADPTTSIAKALQAKAHAFNKLLNQPRLSTKFRTQADVEDGLKKLRRLILVEGIPFTVVSTLRVVGIDVVWCGRLIDFRDFCVLGDFRIRL